MDKQRTIAREVSVSGVGVHTGVNADVVLKPAEANAGIMLVRLDAGREEFVLTPSLSQPSPLCTYLDNGKGGTLSTVEHLLSAVHGLGIDNLLVEVHGPEIPILDGSALPWVRLIDAAGRTQEEAPRNWLKVQTPQIVQEGGRVLMAEPDPRTGLRLACVVDFPHPAIGRQEWRGVIDEDTYRREIAPARTFVLEKDIRAAKAAGLVKGGSLDNAVVFGEDGKVLNKEGLRFVDEPVRHKVLDAVGDLFLAGRPVSGAFHLTAPGHTANNILLQKLQGSC